MLWRRLRVRRWLGRLRRWCGRSRVAQGARPLHGHGRRARSLRGRPRERRGWAGSSCVELSTKMCVLFLPACEGARQLGRGHTQQTQRGMQKATTP